MNDLPIFWESDTHRGVIKTAQGTLADGSPVDLGIWVHATEKKTAWREHALRYDSVDAALRRLNEKYYHFRTVASDLDIVSHYMERTNRENDQSETD